MVFVAGVDGGEVESEEFWGMRGEFMEGENFKIRVRVMGE